jgi:DNA-binding NarL/FixJ family response regulator
LVRLGTTSKEIAAALGVAESGVRTMVPSRSVKKFAFGAGSEED